MGLDEVDSAWFTGTCGQAALERRTGGHSSIDLFWLLHAQIRGIQGCVGWCWVWGRWGAKHGWLPPKP